MQDTIVIFAGKPDNMGAFLPGIRASERECHLGFISAAGKAEAGNGRFCRNLVENVILEYAVRVYGDVASDEMRDCVLVSEDFATANVEVSEEKRGNVIGVRR